MGRYLGSEDNDVLPEGGAGNDLSDDTLNGYGGDDLLFGGMGDDDLRGRSGTDALYGGAGIDTLKGGGGNDTLLGGDDNDLLIGGGGADTLDGGEGDDVYRVSAQDSGSVDTFMDSGTGGHDVIDATRPIWWTLGANFSATTTGIEAILTDGLIAIEGNGSPVIWDFTGMAFVDAVYILIHGGNGNDVITGSDGDDSRIVGFGGDDDLYGGTGNDYLIGQDGNDFVDGGLDDDTLFGNDGDDVLSGGEGSDLLVGGAGNDVMDGGEGSDTYRYASARDGSIQEDQLLDSGTSGTDAVGLAGVTSMQWDGLVNLVAAGIEEIHGDNTDAGTQLRSGDDVVNWDFSGLMLLDIRQITGSGHDDSILGSEGDDRVKGRVGSDALDGGAGNDMLSGGEGDDLLAGGVGDDILKGNRGGDVVSGGSDNDTLKGGGGNDLLSGGTDDDTFVFDTALDEMTNVDAITDFEGAGAAGGDVIRLDHGYFATLTTTSGMLTDAEFEAVASGFATQATTRIVYNTATGALYYDPDGNGSGSAVQFATLTGSPDGLTNEDFLLTNS